MPIANERPNDNPILAVTKTLLAMGFSVIPLREGSKRPAVAWREYQTRRPSEDELADWFGNGRFTNYGVVTGAVSGLFVLDFDNPTLYHQFRQQYPQFTPSLTIRTKRGYHIYYRCDVDSMPDSQKLPELDVQAEGRYVVGSRSVVEGFEYQVEGSPRWPLYLKADKLEAVNGVVGTGTLAGATMRAGLARQAPTRGMMGKGSWRAEASPLQGRQGMDELQALSLYYKLAVERGRNNALFATACACRDAGWWQDKTLHVLGRVHVRQEAPEGHRAETDAQRYAEAERTIESAYSRPARKCKRAKREPASFVPNAVREKAMQSGMTAALRVLEGLMIAGGEAGMLVCYSDLKELLPEMGIGDYSIRQALKTVAPNGEMLFKEVEISPPHTPPDRAQS